MLLPEKIYYTIGDICKLTGIKPHILRYWESQFKLLRPARRYSGHRKFTKQDIDLINKIKFLVIDRRFTLEGAKKEIAKHMSPKNMEGAVGNSPSGLGMGQLRELKRDIETCLDILGPEKQAELLSLD